MKTLSLTDFEADLIAAVRALPADRRDAVLKNARAAVEPLQSDATDDEPPLGSRPVDDPVAAAEWDREYERREQREFYDLAAAKGLVGEDADEFVDFFFMTDAPAPSEPLTGTEIVRRIQEQGPISEEFADELQDILTNECGRIDWDEWDLPAGHLRGGGDYAGECDGPGSSGDPG